MLLIATYEHNGRHFGSQNVTMNELRRQMTTNWPVILRVDGKDIAVNSREELMVPPAGTLICVFRDGAFEVIDSHHVAALQRSTAARQQTN